MKIDIQLLICRKGERAYKEEILEEAELNIYFHKETAFLTIEIDQED